MAIGYGKASVNWVFSCTIQRLLIESVETLFFVFNRKNKLIRWSCIDADTLSLLAQENLGVVHLSKF